MILLLVIYMHALVLTLVQVTDIPGTTLELTYPIETGLIPFGFHGSIIAR